MSRVHFNELQSVRTLDNTEMNTVVGGGGLNVHVNLGRGGFGPRGGFGRRPGFGPYRGYGPRPFGPRYLDPRFVDPYRPAVIVVPVRRPIYCYP